MKTQNVALVCSHCGSSNVEPIIDYEPLDDERAYKCSDCGKEFVITISFEVNEVVITYRDLAAIESRDAIPSACLR